MQMGNDNGGAQRTSRPETASQIRRCLEAGAFVLVWMLIGFALDLDANEYLFVGLPLTIVFQLVVARKPLRALWVRTAPRIEFGKIDWEPWLAIGLLGLLNALFLFVDAFSGAWEIVVYEIGVIAGLFPLAYAINHFSRESLRQALGCLATAGTIGIGTFVVSYLYDIHFSGGTPVSVAAFAGTFLYYLIIYLPAIFMFEEVSFRGALDSHVYHPGEKWSKVTAIYVSALWGLRHFPTAYSPSAGILENALLLGELVAF